MRSSCSAVCGGGAGQRGLMEVWGGGLVGVRGRVGWHTLDRYETCRQAAASGRTPVATLLIPFTDLLIQGRQITHPAALVHLVELNYRIMLAYRGGGIQSRTFQCFTTVK